MFALASSHVRSTMALSTTLAIGAPYWSPRMSLSTGDVASLRLKMYSPPSLWPAYPPPGSGKKLLQVIVAHRHGDRAPISRTAGNNLVPDPIIWAERLPSAAIARRWDAAVPVDGPAEAIDAGEEPFGALTIRGAQQCEALGESIRSSLRVHAPHLLPTEAPHLRLRATNIRRTQQSLQNAMFGLLGTRGDGGGDLVEPEAAQLFDGLNIHVDEFDAREVLIPQPYACPPLMRKMVSLKGEMEAATGSASDVGVLAAAAEALGYPADDPDAFKLDQAREVLVCAYTYGDPVPAKCTASMTEALLRINAVRWGVRYGEPTVARLGMGRLLSEIGGYLDLAAEKAEAAPRIVLLSGHDSTILPLLAALDLFDPPLWPPYAAAVRLELAEGVEEEEGGGSTLHARLLYNDAPLALPALLGLPADPAGWVAYGPFRTLLDERAASAEEVAAVCGAALEEGAASAGGDTSLKDTLVGSDNKKIVPGKDGE